MRKITVVSRVNLPDLPVDTVAIVDMDDPLVYGHIAAGRLQPVRPIPMQDEDKPPKARGKRGDDADDSEASGD